MNRRLVLAALPALLLLTAAAPARRARPAPPPAPLVLPDTVRVAMVTELGTIEIDLDHKAAPLTVQNFMRYVLARRFDGMTFYRAMRLPWGTPPNGLIQAGWQGNPARVMKPVAHEPTSQTGLTHRTGAISMARHLPGTAAADFSIMMSDLPQLDADPKSADPDKAAGFAAFGYVVSGMDVARRIYDAPVSPTAGEGPLKGQMLSPPVRIVSVRRVMPPPAM
jgi:peptidyl-prolyl cis-trans isomerase A (cyclophilin A)